MYTQAYSARSISSGMVGFFRYLRSHGFLIGLRETTEALEVAHTSLVRDKHRLKTALAALCCTSREELALFDRLFAAYWDTSPMDLAERKNQVTVRGQVRSKINTSLVLLGRGKGTGKEEEEATSVSGANAEERLRETDFSKIREIDEKPLEQLAERLFREFAVKMRRKLKATRKPGKVHLARTVRKSIESGGDPLKLFYTTRKLKKRRLVILLDVSGSMDKYSFYLLRFIYALKQEFSNLEAFVFSTRLISITRALRNMKLDSVLREVSHFAIHWSGGTRIGECLRDFNRQYSKYVLHGSPAVIILSDGLETGNPVLLGAEMMKIRRRSKVLIWLNPLKGMKDYQPLAGGMKAALPSVDEFRAAHNLKSLLELEDLLTHV